MALLPPRSRRRAAIVLAAIAVAAALAIHAEVPRAGLVALIAVPGLPALCAWVALARPRPAGPASPAAHGVQLISAAAMIACPVLGVRLLTTSRAAVTAQAADHGITILAHHEGATSVPAWVASNDLGLAIVLLTAITVVAAATFLIARFGFVPVGSLAEG